MKKTRIALVVSLVVILLSACAGRSTNDLAGTRWVLAEINQNPPIEGAQPTITFEESEVSGNTGCNLFSGSYEVDGDAIRFTPLRCRSICWCTCPHSTPLTPA